MKKLELELMKIDKHYVLSVGNKKYLKFNTKKEGLNFCVSFRKDLELSIRQTLNINSQLHTLYRLYYFQLRTSETKKIDDFFSFYSERLEYVFKNFGSGNGGFVFSNIENLYRYNFLIIEELKNFSYKFKEISLKYELLSISELSNISYNYYNSKRNKINSLTITKIKTLKAS